jgi:hypothetical protein
MDRPPDHASEPIGEDQGEPDRYYDQPPGPSCDCMTKGVPFALALNCPGASRKHEGCQRPIFAAYQAG